MRKFFGLLGDFFCNNKIKVLALLIIMTSTCIIFSSSLAHYNYFYSAISFFEQSEFKNADYVDIYQSFKHCCMSKNFESPGTHDATDFNTAYADFVKTDVYGQIEQLPAVDRVYSYYISETGKNEYNNTYISLMFANMDTHRRFNYTLSSGCWFWDTEQSSEYPNVVLCGTAFETVTVGSDIDITYNAKSYRVHVIGKVAMPYHIIKSFGTLHQSLDTDGNTLFFLDNGTALKTFGEQIKRYPSSAIVTYKANATDEEIKECQSFYNSFFTEEEFEKYAISPFTSVQNNIEYSKQVINGETRDMIRKDTVFVIIAAFMFIALTVLMVKKKLHDYYIFYFCGCTRKKSFWISVAGISVMAIAAGLIASGYIMYSYYMISHGYLNGSQNAYIFDGRCYLAVWLYLLFVVLVSCIIPFVMVASKKSTLMNLYRKGKE